MDQYSGAILSDVRYNDFGFGAKLVESGIALHEGRLFGWVNQALGLMTCLGLMGLIGTSFVMWRKRAPKGTFAAPRKSIDKKNNVDRFWHHGSIWYTSAVSWSIASRSSLHRFRYSTSLFFKKEDQLTM